MKRSAEGIAPFVGCRPHGSAGCCLVVILLFSLLFSVCEAKLPLKLLLEAEDRRNVTVTADNVCIKNIVDEEQIVYYNLDLSECFEDPYFGYRYLEVEARIFQQCGDSHEWSVLVNTEGELVSIQDARELKDGTFVDFIDAEHHQYYGHLDIPLDRNVSRPWVLGFYSNCGPVQYTLKAWCSANKGCKLSCSDPETAPCISLENCRCTKGNDEDGCSIDVEDLPDEEDVVTRYGLTQSHNGDTLRYGTWKYFRFQAYNSASRILVELKRAYGDVILFVKQEDSDGGLPSGDSLPKEQDAFKYADLSSFQNRLSYHHVFINGSGNFYIGVYNTDRCVEEDTTFNITITIATPSDPLNLCPLNCSYPQGQCVRDNVCSCEPGYGGNHCAATLRSAGTHRTFGGQLLPGEWAYINMTMGKLTDNGDVSVQFSSSTGHPILLAQENRLPSLKDFQFKFSNSTLGATPSDTYNISGASLSSGVLVLGVFNVDYGHRGVADFEIVIIGTHKGLSIWIIILVAIGSSIFLLTVIATVRHSLNWRGQVVAESWGLDFEAVHRDLEMVEMVRKNAIMVSTLPLLAYHQGMLPKEDVGCSICLSSYSEGEIVCRLPGCKHVFHVRCLEEWFQTDDSCPLCRVPLQEQGRKSSREPSPQALSSELGPPIPEPSNFTQVPGKPLDPQTPSIFNHKIGGQPASSKVNDNRPLLNAEGESSSLGSSSNSEERDSDSPPSLQHLGEVSSMAACIVSSKFS